MIQSSRNVTASEFRGGQIEALSRVERVGKALGSQSHHARRYLCPVALLIKRHWRIAGNQQVLHRYFLLGYSSQNKQSNMLSFIGCFGIWANCINQHEIKVFGLKTASQSAAKLTIEPV